MVIIVYLVTVLMERSTSALGLAKQFATYKAQAANKLVLSVPAHHTSQECSECHKIDPLSRVSQDVFKCTSCSHTENADFKAAKGIAASRRTCSEGTHHCSARHGH